MTKQTKNNFTFRSALIFLLAGLVLALQVTIASAQESEGTGDQAGGGSAPTAPKQLTDEQKTGLDESLQTISRARAEIPALEKRVENARDIMRTVLEKRTDDLLVSTIETALSFAEEVADLRDDGYDISAYRDEAVWALETLPTSIERSAERIRDRIEMPDFSRPAIEQAAVDDQFFKAVGIYNQINRALLDTGIVAERFGIDVGDLEARAREHVESSTINSSVFLDLAVAEVSKVRAGLKVKPEDEELIAMLKVAESRVADTAVILESNIDSLEDLDLPASQYKQQVLKATGALTTSALDLSVLANIARQWGSDIYDAIVSRGTDVLFQAFFFLLIVWVFAKLARLVQRAVDRGLDANRQHLSQLLRQMISSVSKNVVILIGILIALAQFGISVGPLLAGLGIAGFILGFALQDSLSNFASGLMILFYRPFDVGDTVQVAGVSGKVSNMSLVNTTIRTFDNQSMIIPNNKIWQDVITNVTDQLERRVDLEFGITYDEDIDRVEKLLADVLAADERILTEPKPAIKVGSFGDSSVNILCRPWVKTEDYWDVYWDLNKTVKQAFDREGIVIPFPQREVRVITDAENAVGKGPAPESASQ